MHDLGLPKAREVFAALLVTSAVTAPAKIEQSIIVTSSSDTDFAFSSVFMFTSFSPSASLSSRLRPKAKHFVIPDTFLYKYVPTAEKKTNRAN